MPKRIRRPRRIGVKGPKTASSVSHAESPPSHRVPLEPLYGASAECAAPPQLCLCLESMARAGLNLYLDMPYVWVEKPTKNHQNAMSKSKHKSSHPSKGSFAYKATPRSGRSGFARLFTGRSASRQNHNDHDGKYDGKYLKIVWLDDVRREDVRWEDAKTV